MATPTSPVSTWLMARTATIVVAEIITLPCTREAGHLITLPTMTEPDHPNQQVDHPREREQDLVQTTILAGVDPAIDPAGTSTGPQAKALPAAPPPNVQAGAPKERGDLPPAGTIRIALS